MSKFTAAEVLDEACDMVPSLKREMLRAFAELLADLEQGKLVPRGANALNAAANGGKLAPDGMVMVPREPTEAMIKAMWDCWRGNHDKNFEYWQDDLYRAMLDAAMGEKPTS